jgi:hypothetical protein
MIQGAAGAESARNFIPTKMITHQNDTKVLGWFSKIIKPTKMIQQNDSGVPGT